MDLAIVGRYAVDSRMKSVQSATKAPKPVRRVAEVVGLAGEERELVQVIERFEVDFEVEVCVICHACGPIVDGSHRRQRPLGGAQGSLWPSNTRDHRCRGQKFYHQKTANPRLRWIALLPGYFRASDQFSELSTHCRVRHPERQPGIRVQSKSNSLKSKIEMNNSLWNPCYVYAYSQY